METRQSEMSRKLRPAAAAIIGLVLAWYALAALPPETAEHVKYAAAGAAAAGAAAVIWQKR